MKRYRFPHLPFLIFGLALLVYGVVMYRIDQSGVVLRSARYLPILISGWSLVVVGWIGGVANRILDAIGDLKQGTRE
ncbi:MAG: hypothetical protein M1133_08475 [Armatimonadetes bacterium]|nr:hypothetical protein [Armatimonadota bacterium]